MALLSLDSTGEVLLDGDETFGNFYIDRTGGVGLENEVVQRVIIRLGKALNIQHEQVSKLQLELDELCGSVHAVKESGTDSEKLLRKCEDAITDVQIEIGKVSAKLDMVDKRSQQERDTRAIEAAIQRNIETLRDHKECINDLSVRMEATERTQREDSKKFSGELEECNEKLERHQEAVDEELEQRLRDADDSVLSLKLDLEAAQVSLTESNKIKANRSELEGMQKNLKTIFETMQKDHDTLEEASKNLNMLDTVVAMSHENKSRVEEVWRVFREESQELRDWASRILGEVREGLREKMNRADAMHSLQDLQRQLHGNTSRLAEAAARAEKGMLRKAELGDVQRLQHTVQNIRPPSESKARQLLVGMTKCIACDRDIPPEEADPSVVDVAKEHQQQELYKEVQRAISQQSQHGGYGGQGGSQDVLKYVAVHVGSPRRAPCSGGVGPFELRDPDGEGAQLVPSAPSSRPTTRGGGFAASSPAAAAVAATTAAATEGAVAPMPMRAPAREAPPLVRMLPRRPGFGPGGGAGRGAGRGAGGGGAPGGGAAPGGQGGYSDRNPHGLTHSSLKAALATPREPASSRGRRPGPHPAVASASAVAGAAAAAAMTSAVSGRHDGDGDGDLASPGVPYSFAPTEISEGGCGTPNSAATGGRSGLSVSLPQVCPLAQPGARGGEPTGGVGSGEGG